MVRVRVRTARGFTLVELAVVVVIVGILAVVAVVGYRKMTLSSKVTEAQNMVQAIRLAEEDYKTEKGSYYGAGAAYCPDPALTPNQKNMWNSSCNTNKWQNLAVHADGPVQFGYRALANGDEGQLGAITTAGADMGALVTTRPWFVVDSKADLNADGSAGLYTRVVTTSQGNQVFVLNSGE